MTTRKDKKEYSIQAVENAMRLLREFKDGETLGVTELARRLKLHKNNVFRVLATLEQDDFIEQDASSGSYRLGVAALQLGQWYSRAGDLMSRSRPVLRELSESTGETTHLGVLRGHRVVHLDGAESAQHVLTALRVGEPLPVHCTALGKALLGCARPEVREDFDREVASAPGLERRTEATIVDRDKLFEHLRTSAVRGFALDLEECESGLVCAAAAIFDGEGLAVAAISVSAPAFRMDEASLLQGAVPRVTAAANRISRELGYATG